MMTLPVLSRCLPSHWGDMCVKTPTEVEPSQGFMKKACGGTKGEVTAQCLQLGKSL